MATLLSRSARLSVHSALILVLFSVTPATATDLYTVYVAPKGSDAYTAAKSLPEDPFTLGVERRIHRAFKRAHDTLSACGTCEVHVKIAGGQYEGRTGAGHWQFADIQAPDATLRILGGYDTTFTTRDPFQYPTELVTSVRRSAPVLSFDGKKHSLKELMVSGLTIDVSAGNAYDADTNSVLKGSSSSWPLITFGYITTDRLVISDNVFMNATHGVASPRIRAMSDRSQVVVFNNFFINNIHTWVIEEGGYKNTVDRYIVASNSFVMNWPYNPDPTTSNPGTLEIGDRYSANSIDIVGNLFAYNVGGAIHTQYDEDRTPVLNLRDNLFWGNGSLFGDVDSDSGAVVGKFAGAATYATLSAEDLEDDFDWEVSNNPSFDPALILAAPAFKAVSYPERRGRPNQPAQAETEDLDALGDELLALIEDDAAPLIGEDPMSVSLDDSMQDFESSFGFNESDDTVQIEGYAPYYAFNPDQLPIPMAAPDVGADPSRVTQY